MSRKFALIIGNSEYEDTSLSRLKTPDADVPSLAAALRDPELGGFDEVQEIINQPESTVSRAISTFFSNKKPDDLLLLYFSGHGVLDPQGRLFLAVKDTQRSLLNATALPASFITDDMDTCRSRRQILILDCCHSGAFAKGSKGDAPAVTKSTFEGNGYGRVVLTASDSTQYALEGDQVIQQAALSLFTHYLLEGLTTGAADSAQDGWITLDEWYDYAYERVIGETPDQTPRKWVYNQQGELVVARSPRPVQPQELPQELQAALHSQFAGIRLEAVSELRRLLKSGKTALVPAIQEALQQIAEHDDSRRVSMEAAAALEEYASGQGKGTALAKEDIRKKAEEEKAEQERNRREEEKLELKKAELERIKPTPAFMAYLSGQTLPVSGSGSLFISNKGNTSLILDVNFQAIHNDIRFSPPHSQVTLAAGESQVLNFMATPTTRMYVGGEKRLPFNVLITAPGDESQSLPGELTVRAVLPAWAIPAALGFLVVCISSLALLNGTLARNRSAASATQTGQAQQTAIAAVLLGTLTTQSVSNNEETPAVGQSTPTSPSLQEVTSTEISIVGETNPSPTTPVEVVAPTQAAANLDDWRLAYASNQDGNWNIYIAKADGSEPRRLTDDQHDDSFPVWSPDGSKILFHSDRNGNFDLFVMNMDGSGLVQLTTNPTADTFPVWSADGNRIAYQSRREGNKEIFIMNADGSQQTQLTHNSSEESWPTFAPDGGKLIYTSNRDGNLELYKLEIASGEERRQTYTDGDEAYPSWSPTGDLVAYSYVAIGSSNTGSPKFALQWAHFPKAGDNILALDAILGSPLLQAPPGSQDIYLFDFLTGGRELTTQITGEDHPRWSLDGRALLFDVNVNGAADLFICQPVEIGCTPRQLTNTPYDEDGPALK